MKDKARKAKGHHFLKGLRLACHVKESGGGDGESLEILTVGVT